MNECKQDYCVVLNLQGETTCLPKKKKKYFLYFHVQNKCTGQTIQPYPQRPCLFYFPLFFFFPTSSPFFSVVKKKSFWMQFLIYPFYFGLHLKSCPIAQALNTYFSHSLKKERKKKIGLKNEPILNSNTTKWKG